MFVPRCLSRWVVSSFFIAEKFLFGFYDFCKPKLDTRLWSNWHLICISLGLSVSYSRFESTPTTLIRILTKYKERLLNFRFWWAKQLQEIVENNTTKVLDSFSQQKNGAQWRSPGSKLIKFNLQSRLRVIIWFYWVPPIKFFPASRDWIITRLVRYETRRCYTSRDRQSNI